MAEACNDDPNYNHSFNEKNVREAMEQQISLGRFDIAMVIEELFQPSGRSSKDSMIAQKDYFTQEIDKVRLKKSMHDDIVQYLHCQEEKGRTLPEELKIVLNSVKVSY